MNIEIGGIHYRLHNLRQIRVEGNKVEMLTTEARFDTVEIGDDEVEPLRIKLSQLALGGEGVYSSNKKAFALLLFHGLMQVLHTQPCILEAKYAGEDLPIPLEINDPETMKETFRIMKQRAEIEKAGPEGASTTRRGPCPGENCSAHLAVIMLVAMAIAIAFIFASRNGLFERPW